MKEHSLLVEKYIKDSISRPAYYIDRLLNADLIHPTFTETKESH